LNRGLWIYILTTKCDFLNSKRKKKPLTSIPPPDYPTKSVPNMIAWFEKYDEMLHFVFDSVADGTPQSDGLGVPPLISFGIAAR